MVSSTRGSHACKSPLDDTTYEAFPVSCTPALALTTIARERTQLLESRTSHAQTQQRLIQTQAETEKLRAKIKSVKNDPRVSENAAQDRLNYVRPNEIVVPIR